MIRKYIYKLRYILIILSALLGLLGLSNSFGGYVRPVGVYGYNPYIQSYDINLTRTGNPLTQVLGMTKQVFVLNQYNGYNNSPAFVGWWWGYNGIPYVYSRRLRGDGNYGSLCQGYITRYSVCDEIYGTGQSNAPGNCVSNNVSAGSKDVFGGFLDSLTANDYYYFDFSVSSAYSNTSEGMYCISSSNVGSSICWSLSNGDCDLFSGSMGFSNLDFDSLNTAYLYNPPTLNGAGGGPVGQYDNTNRGVYDAYGEAGYYRGLCYSDFSINSLATLSGGLQQFYEIEREDGEYYTGAKITDLRLFYGSGMDFSTWFNYRYVQYKNSLALSTTSLNPAANYVGKSKGLWYMVYKYYLAGLGNDNINYTKLYNYCNYYQDFDFNDGTANLEYSGPDLPDNVSVLVNNNFQFGSGILGHFTGDDQSFDAESFFNQLTTKLNDLLGSPDDSYRGIIPPYILMVLLALIFIRLISH